MPSSAEYYLEKMWSDGIPVEGVPTTLGDQGGLVVEGVASGTPIPSSDAGPAQTLTRTYTASADMSTAAAITVAPTTGMKVVAMDIMVSADTAMNFSIQMETSAVVLAKVFLPANGTVQITLRGFIKGDTIDKRLFGKASASGNVAVTVVQFSEA